MTYRDDDAALAAALDEVEAEVRVVESERQRLDVQLRERRRAVRARRFTRAALAAAAVAAVVLVYGLTRRKVRDDRDAHALLLADAENDDLAREIERERRAARTVDATSRLRETIGVLSPKADGPLFEQVRTLDPRMPADAWLVVGLAACRRHEDDVVERAARALDAEHASSLRASCAASSRGGEP